MKNQRNNYECLNCGYETYVTEATMVVRDGPKCPACQCLMVRKK